jgi:uncharacterized protein YdeI (YjbR/CyaY-like superfamily)
MEEQLLFSNRLKFREWLIDNNSSNKGIWLIFGKNGRLETISPEDALEEALCFGWIDGQIKSIDETKYIKKFTPRRKGSKWSEKNKRIAVKLIEEGLMGQKGLAAIEQAKKDGTWDAPKAQPIIDEQISILVDVLRGFEPAFSNFQNMSRSVRATYTAHYLSAKSDETKKRRLEQIIGRLNENKKPM